MLQNCRRPAHGLREYRFEETSVNILLFAGSPMSVFRLGLSRSEYRRRPRGRPHGTIGNTACRGGAPALHEKFSFHPDPARRTALDGPLAISLPCKGGERFASDAELEPELIYAAA